MPSAAALGCAGEFHQRKAAPTAKEIDRHLQQSARLSLNQLTVSIELSEIELTPDAE
jgi:hypothetical protein